MSKFLFDFIAYFLYRRRAMKYANIAFRYNKALAFNDVTSKEKLEIDNLWKCLSIAGRYRYKWHSFYKGFCGSFDKRFVPSDIYNGLIEYTLNLRKYSICLQHKAILGNFIESKNRCHTIINVIDNICYDNDMNIISAEEAVNKVRSCNCDIIIKPSIGSGGGRKINFMYAENVKQSDFIDRGDCIIQEIFHEGFELLRFNPDTLNTIRMLTLNINGKCTVLSAFLRMGAKGMRVDNLSAGGILVGIKSNGDLHDFALDKKLNRIYKSPAGIEFKGESLVCYKRLKEFALNTHKRIALANLIAWDLTIDEEGNPIVVEINLDSGEIQFHQIYNGPLFGERTNEVIEYVKSHPIRRIDAK